MSYLIVLPSIYKPYTHECIASMSESLKDNLLLIDNTHNNLGVSKSWNMGIDKLKADNRDWLILLSAAIRFGKEGGKDFIQRLENEENHFVMEALGVFGWHLIAFHRQVAERVGYFDENLFPGYYNDIDYSWRVQKTFALRHQEGLPLWTKVLADVTDMGMAHGINLAGISTTENNVWDYMNSKWGHTQAPYFEYPFNDSSKLLSYWPSNG